MSVGPFPVALVITRLAEVSLLRHVDGAAGLAAAEKQQPPSTPAAYVIANERAKPVKGYSGGGMVQEVEVTIVVVYYVKHQGTAATGVKAQAELDALRAATREKLLNWRPNPGMKPLFLIASDGESYQAGSLQGQDAFGSTYNIDQGANP